MLKRFFADKNDESLDNQIAAVLQRMDEIGVDDEDYPKMVEILDSLYSLKAKKRREPVSRNTIALICGNLAGIIVIVAYERTHANTSKGYGQLIRPN